MPHTLKKITISESILELLRTTEEMRAVILPDIESQRIKMLVSPSERVCESHVFDVNAFDGLSDGPKKVLLAFEPIVNSCDLKLKSIVEEGSSNSLDASLAAYTIGVSDIDNVIHEAVRTYGAYRVHFAHVTIAESKIVSDKVDIEALTKAYREDELLSYGGLLNSAYQVFVVDMNGIETELNASMRTASKPVYSQNDEHPHYSVKAWQYEMENSDTHSWYNDWVQHKIEADASDAQLAGNSAMGALFGKAGLINVDDAIEQVLREGQLSLFETTVGVYESKGIDTPINLHKVIVAAKNSNACYDLTDYACLKATFDPLKYYAPVDGFYEVLDWCDIENIVKFVQDCDGVIVENFINEFTHMTTSFQGNKVWDVNHVKLNEYELSNVLIREFCSKTQQELESIMFWATKHIADNEENASTLSQ